MTTGDKRNAPGSVKTVHVAVTTGALQFVVMALMLVRSKLFAMLLGPLGVGIVSTLDQLVQFIVQVTSFGLTVAPSRVIPRVADQGSLAVSRAYGALLVALALAVGVGTCMFLAIALLDSGLLVPDSGVPRNAVAIAVAGAPLMALTLFFTSVLSVTVGHRVAMAYVIAASAASLALSYCGAWLAGIPGLYAGALLAGLLVSMAGAWRLADCWTPGRHVNRAAVWAELRKHENLGAFLGTAYLLSFTQPLAFLLVRSVLVGSRGAAEAGHFQAAFAIAGVFSMLLTQTGRLYFEPQVNRESMPRERARLTHDYIRVMAGLMVVGAVPLALLPDLAVRILFSSAFLPAAPFLFVFVLADCLFVAGSVYLTTLRAQDDLRWSFGISVGGSVLLAAVAWLLVPEWGLAGAAIAFLSSRALTLVVAAIRLSAVTGTRFSWSAGCAVLYLVACVALFGLLSLAIARDSAMDVAMRTGLLLAALGGTVAMLHADERRWVRESFGRWLGRYRSR